MIAACGSQGSSSSTCSPPRGRGRGGSSGPAREDSGRIPASASRRAVDGQASRLGGPGPDADLGPAALGGRGAGRPARRRDARPAGSPLAVRASISPSSARTTSTIRGKAARARSSVAGSAGASWRTPRNAPSSPLGHRLAQPGDSGMEAQRAGRGRPPRRSRPGSGRPGNTPRNRRPGDGGR